MRTTLATIFLISALCWAGCSSAPKAPEAPAVVQPPKDYLNESQAELDARMEWWREARFGMFIHWGAYAVPAGTHKGNSTKNIAEWIMTDLHIPVAEYEEYTRQFNPEKYDPEAWVRIAKDAGMKYIVITSKHHEGFALWDSKTSTYDAVDFAAAQRDLIKPLKEACDKAGIKLCFYHSIMDWHHPDAQAPHFPDYNTDKKSNPNFPLYYENYMKPQLKELVEMYDPAILWFDGEWIPEFTHAQGQDLYNYVRNLKPNIIINNRVDKGRQGMQGMNKDDQKYAGDYGTPEQEILEGSSAYDWESCMTMNDTWGFNSADDNWKSAETLVFNLVDCAAKGGNYLLNVGPTAAGEIPAPSIERLAEVGTWMRINSEAIYGSKLLPQFKDGDKVRYTQTKDPGTVYAISYGWPGKSLALNHLQPEAGSTITLLGYDKPIEWNMVAGKLVLSLPADLDKDPAKRPCKYAYVFKVKGKNS